MPEASPRLGIPLPSEFEEPYYQTGRDRDLAWDVGMHANAENSQLQFLSTGIVGWDKDAGSGTNGVLFWTEDIQVTGFFSPFRAVIAGGVSAELQDGEILFFIMPRVLRDNPTVTLYRANRIFLESTRVHDLRLFAARVGDTIYFPNGASLIDDQQGGLFGGGLFPSTIVPLHNHEAALVIEPPSSGISLLDTLMTSPDLLRVDIFRNGKIIAEPADYGMNYATGIATLVVPTTSGSERFVVWRETRDPVSAVVGHQHLSPLVIEPAPATAVLDILVTTPVLEGADMFRNGALMAEPGDYTLDLTTGFVSLVVPSVLNERFVALRRIIV